METLWFDGNKVDLPDASFEIIATYSVLHHIPDYVSALNEMCRLVKSG
ncbi:MAG: methyltransferase domain-containing protein [Candidatus Peribacteria bacterium]|nr:MAG: methyltransferase domain-containing protein [Candidatus Peribacteria bacterium]